MPIPHDKSPRIRYAVTFAEAEACKHTGLSVEFNGNFTATVTCTEAELRKTLAGSRRR